MYACMYVCMYLLFMHLAPHLVPFKFTHMHWTCVLNTEVKTLGVLCSPNYCFLMYIASLQSHTYMYGGR